MPQTSPVVPCLSIDGAKAAIDFYKKAFAAEEISRADAEDGKRLIHAHLRINGGDLYMWDFFPEYGGKAEAPAAVIIHLEVDDAEAWWKRAVDAGATVTMPIEDTFWGMRYGQLRDPFGHGWSIGAPLNK
jgi:PhnB protein